MDSDPTNKCTCALCRSDAENTADLLARLRDEQLLEALLRKRESANLEPFLPRAPQREPVAFGRISVHVT